MRAVRVANHQLGQRAIVARLEDERSSLPNLGPRNVFQRNALEMRVMGQRSKQRHKSTRHSSIVCFDSYYNMSETREALSCAFTGTVGEIQLELTRAHSILDKLHKQTRDGNGVKVAQSLIRRNQSRCHADVHIRWRDVVAQLQTRQMGRRKSCFFFLISECDND